jgi:cytochrome c oxidase assembly protein subunit 15
MNLQSWVRLFSKVSLVFVFVVIIAGSIVRITGSGMGCPDWPRCFGYNIPPLTVEPLLFSEDHGYSKKQMIIRNDTLWVANKNFVSGKTFDRGNWHKYPKHDYATFNPVHTWIEYINRLATVLFGIPVAVLFVLSIFYWIRKKDGATFLLAGFTLLMLGFEAWLGKMVVDGNLKENSITYHMIGSVAIVALLLVLVFRHRKMKTEISVPNRFKVLLCVMVVLAFVQIMLGTQVREEIDVIAKNIDVRSSWIENLSGIFKLHRSFSILISAVAIGLFLMNRRSQSSISQVNAAVIVVALEVVVGIVLSYFAMPELMQPTHLLLAIMLFAFSFYGLLRTFTVKSVTVK